MHEASTVPGENGACHALFARALVVFNHPRNGLRGQLVERPQLQVTSFFAETAFFFFTATRHMMRNFGTLGQHAPMIGKSLSERSALGALPHDRAIALLRDALPAQAKLLVDVRARDARMIACLVLDADKASVRMCKGLGFRMKLGGTGVFGLYGADAARLIAAPTDAERAWLEAACGARETKVLLVAGGTALLSIVTSAGAVEITAAP